MRQPDSRVGEICAAPVGPGSVEPPKPTQLRPQGSEAALRRRSIGDGGILVEESELGLVTAQQLFKMRCECGRSWFELELPKFIQCPACHKIKLVCR